MVIDHENRKYVHYQSPPAVIHIEGADDRPRLLCDSFMRPSPTPLDTTDFRSDTGQRRTHGRYRNMRSAASKRFSQKVKRVTHRESAARDSAAARYRSIRCECGHSPSSGYRRQHTRWPMARATASSLSKEGKRRPFSHCETVDTETLSSSARCFSGIPDAVRQARSRRLKRVATAGRTRMRLTAWPRSPRLSCPLCAREVIKCNDSTTRLRGTCSLLFDTT